jgi:hypothetical protein
MKIRNGFVSNSSSSSFIVAFNKKVSSSEEMKEILYGDSDTIEHYDDKHNTIDLAREVFNKFRKMRDVRKSGKVAEVVRTLGGGYYFLSKNCGHFNKNGSLEFGPKMSLESKFLGSDRHLLDKLTRAHFFKEKLRSNSSVNFNDPRFRKIENDINILERKLAKKDWMNFEKKHRDHIIVHFEFSDDSRVGACLEHGDTFKNLPYIRISHH